MVYLVEIIPRVKQDPLSCKVSAITVDNLATQGAPRVRLTHENKLFVFDIGTV